MKRCINIRFMLTSIKQPRMNAIYEYKMNVDFNKTLQQEHDISI